MLTLTIGIRGYKAKMHEMDLIEFLIKEGHTDIAESIKDYRKNTIKMCVKDVENIIAKGTSKIGGFPDLPPEIPYPTMSGYSCKRGDDTERYEKSAMQLVAQINLADIADLDIENRLPHTGILYFFWSGEIDSIHQTNKWVESVADDPENSAYHKVIWYNGDLSNLKRTEPPVPYYSKYFTETFEEKAVEFGLTTDYQPLGDVLDCDLFDRLEEVAPDYDIEYLSYDGNKLFGYPTGGNIPDVNAKTHLLFQYGYNIGCLWNIFWIISDEDLKNRNFDKAVFSFDLD